MSNSNQKTSRLTFIDVGRALAIILMLQGHFISTTFEGYTEMTATLRATGTSGNIFFDIWCQFRGFTAPLFFTITGLVFSYLLCKSQDGPFFKRKRVRRGLVRGVTIMLWGYALQLSINRIDMYMSGQVNHRFYAFHVLQSIGLGILALILIYWIATKIKAIPFEVYLIVFGSAIFVLKPLVTGGNGYFPLHAHEVIQNAFYGPNSVFPIFPWFGFVFLGGAMGVLINKFQDKLTQKWFPLRITAIGIACCLSAHAIIHIIGKQSPMNAFLGRGYWQFNQLAVIILILGFILYISQKTTFKIPFLVAIGQNTLVVYIVHVILLYGAITGLGIKTYLNKSLSFGESIIGAILFILLFGLLTKYQPHLERAIKGLFAKRKPSEK